MRRIDKSGQDPKGEKGAGKHDAALDELRKIKESLSRAGSVEEIKYLILKFNNVAGGVPGELIPSDLTDDAIEAVYTSKIAQITDPRQPISQQDLQSGEKTAERALKGLIFINDKLDEFLNREDIKASIKRNEVLANRKNPMTAQDAKDVLEDDAKTKDEEELMKNTILATSVKDILEETAKEGAKIKDPEERKKYCEVRNQHLKNHLKKASEVNNIFKNKAKIYERKEMQALVGEDAAAVRVEELQADANSLDQHISNTIADLKGLEGFEDIIMGLEVTSGKRVPEMPVATKIDANMTMQPEIRTVGGFISPPTTTIPSKGQDTPSEGITR